MNIHRKNLWNKEPINTLETYLFKTNEICFPEDIEYRMFLDFQWDGSFQRAVFDELTDKLRKKD